MALPLSLVQFINSSVLGRFVPDVSRLVKVMAYLVCFGSSWTDNSETLTVLQSLLSWPFSESLGLSYRNEADDLSGNPVLKFLLGVALCFMLYIFRHPQSL